MGYVYILKIINIEYNNKDIILYIHVTPTGAGDPNYFPEKNGLKRFFFMSLNSIYLDRYPKKEVLGLVLPINKKPTNSFDIYKKFQDFKIGPFYNFNLNKVDELMRKEKNWVEWYDKNSHKFIKYVKKYKTSYKKLVELLKLNDFKNELNSNDKIVRKRCCYCKRIFKCKNDIPIERLINRSKCVLDTENKNLIISYLKNKAGINITKIPNIDKDFYNWGEQCQEHFFFEYPEEIIYFCYSVRSCSSECALKDVLEKNKEEIFDGKDIIHTYSSVEYKVVLDKKEVDIKLFEKLKNITFGTTGF